MAFPHSRRTFIKAGMAAGVVSFAGPVFGGGKAAAINDDVLVVVFLRGGMDGLNLVPPIAGPDRALYEAARPGLQVPLSGTEGALPLDAQFGLYPAAAPLMPFWQSGRMALVHATGMHDPTRSHFEAEDFIEMGTPGSKSIGSGWLYRHLLSADNLPDEIPIPSLAAGYYQPTSLAGSTETLNLATAGNFNFTWGPWLWQNAERMTQRRLYGGGTTAIHQAGLQAMNAVDLVDAYVTDDYQPGGGAVYPDREFGDLLKFSAQLLKADIGIRIVTVDLGGWDTHEGQGVGEGSYYWDMVETLAQGLAAFYTDLESDGHTDGLTIATMTEFGRRFEENSDFGTDHGHGAPMLLLGPHVNGGFHGTWPGLAADQLFEELDLEVTTDYRRILSEILIRRLANNHLGVVFPGYTDYSPLGVVEGEDMPPDYSENGDGIFGDGFESGDTSAW